MPTTLMIKDHKTWSVDGDLPSRPVMGGNVGGNAGISEFVSLVLEPVADEMKGKVEINSTGGLLNDIETLNDEIAEEMRNKFSSRQEGLDPDDGITEEQSNSKEPSKEQSNQETENKEVRECSSNHHQ